METYQVAILVAGFAAFIYSLWLIYDWKPTPRSTVAFPPHHQKQIDQLAKFTAFDIETIDLGDGETAPPIIKYPLGCQCGAQSRANASFCHACGQPTALKIAKDIGGALSRGEPVYMPQFTFDSIQHAN